MSSRRYLLLQQLNILDLNTDVLDSIFDLVSVQDACRFRLCSQRAAQAAARRAMSSKTISIVTQRWLDFMMKRREKIALIQKLTLVFPTPHQTVTSDLSTDFVEFLRAASGVKEFVLNTPAETFGQIPRYPQIITRFSLLQALELPNSGSETSSWILSEPHGFSSRLTRLYLGVLNFPDSDVPPVRPLSTLRSLSVKFLSGNLGCLVQFAPHIVQLQLIADYDTTRQLVRCISGTSVVPTAPSHFWQSLLRVSGSLYDVYRILPLFQRVDRLVLMHHRLQATEQHVITETLQRKQPCCLELQDYSDHFPFACYRSLPHIAMRLFYLRIRLPCEAKQCLVLYEFVSFRHIH
ncbi:hypothetical protein EIP86_000881 [Pleurotus ostreatoroseus]|nr:hypothetical protein EIP86_000881 [Pleurotus ostreatoroseus]